MHYYYYHYQKEIVLVGLVSGQMCVLAIRQSQYGVQ
jgi:hypothetical protein